MREDIFTNQQRLGLAVTNPDSVKPDKPFIPDNYNNQMNLNKIKRENNFTKTLLEIRSWDFSEDEVSIYTNNKSAVENMLVWQKVLSSYREGDVVYIESKTGHPAMVGK